MIIFDSMTPLMRARELLSRHGIMTRVIRTPSSLRRGSCGSSLLVRRGLDRAVVLLRQRRIPFVRTAEADLP